MKAKNKLWEYLVINNADTNKLKELGANGWELVSVVFVPSFIIGNMQTFQILKFYFKRQLMA